MSESKRTSPYRVPKCKLVSELPVNHADLPAGARIVPSNPPRGWRGRTDLAPELSHAGFLEWLEQRAELNERLERTEGRDRPTDGEDVHNAQMFADELGIHGLHVEPNKTPTLRETAAHLRRLRRVIRERHARPLSRLDVPRIIESIERFYRALENPETQPTWMQEAADETGLTLPSPPFSTRLIFALAMDVIRERIGPSETLANIETSHLDDAEKFALVELWNALKGEYSDSSLVDDTQQSRRCRRMLDGTLQILRRAAMPLPPPSNVARSGLGQALASANAASNVIERIGWLRLTRLSPETAALYRQVENEIIQFGHLAGMAIDADKLCATGTYTQDEYWRRQRERPAYLESLLTVARTIAELPPYSQGSDSPAGDGESKAKGAADRRTKAPRGKGRPTKAERAERSDDTGLQERLELAVLKQIIDKAGPNHTWTRAVRELMKSRKFLDEIEEAALPSDVATLVERARRQCPDPAKTN